MNIDIRFVRNILTPHFGGLVTSVACALMKRGRQTVHQLSRTSGHSQNIIKNALVVLIQHGLAVYYVIAESNKDLTYYSICEHKIKWRLRIPQYIKLASDKYREEGKLIMHQIILNGRLSLRQLLTKTTISEEVFVQMVYDRYLIPSTPDSCLSSVDTRLSIEKKIKDSFGPMPQAKDIKELAQSIRHEMAVSELENAVQVGLKRKLGISSVEQQANKAFKSWELNPAQTYTINHHYLHKQMRYAMLNQLAQQKLNLTASKIYASVLDLVHQQVVLSTCSNTLLPGTTTDCDGQQQNPVVTPAQVQNKVVLTSMCMDYTGIVMDSVQVYEDYLDLLDHHKLLVKDTFRTAYAIPGCTEIRLLLAVHLADKYIVNRFGSIGLRVFRALCVRHKLEEKQIATSVMLPIASVRNVCYQLNQLQLITILPIPKSMDRAPSRTVYVYGVEPTQVALAMYKLSCQALCNLMDRLNALESVCTTQLAAAARKRKRALLYQTSSNEQDQRVDQEDDQQVLHTESAKITLRIAVLRLERDLVALEEV